MRQRQQNIQLGYGYDVLGIDKFKSSVSHYGPMSRFYSRPGNQKTCHPFIQGSQGTTREQKNNKSMEGPYASTLMAVRMNEK